MTAADPSKPTRTALVTGAAAGIGLATAKLLSRNGYAVVMADRDANALARAALEAGPACMTIAIDVAEIGAAQEIDAAVRQRFDPVSVLVNNAGIAPKYNGKPADALEVTLEEWALVFAVNVTSPLLMCKQFLPSMIEAGWGRIINLSSLAGRTTAQVNGAAYMTSKAGILGLTRHMAALYAKHGVTSNAVAPGRVRTALAEAAGTQAEINYAQRAPVGRIGRPEEVASAIAFLASEDSGFVNGAVIDVNGGIAML